MPGQAEAAFRFVGFDMTTTTGNALDRFIARARAHFAAESDLERRWKTLAPLLADLLADPEVVAASKHWPDCVPRDGRAENLLFYEDPEFKFSANPRTS